MFENFFAFAMVIVLGKWNFLEDKKLKDFYYSKEKEAYKNYVDQVKLEITERSFF